MPELFEVFEFSGMKYKGINNLLKMIWYISKNKAWNHLGSFFREGFLEL